MLYFDNSLIRCLILQHNTMEYRSLGIICRFLTGISRFLVKKLILKLKLIAYLEPASKTEPDYVRPNHFHELWFFEWILRGPQESF